MQRKSARFGKWYVVVCAFVITLFSTFICTESLAKEQALAKDLQSQKQLTTEELQWLHQHGKIRMAYISNLLGNCAKDPATGKLIGSLATYVDGAKNCFTNGHLEFIPFAYPSIEAEIAALERGEVDCIFPLYTDAAQAEKRGFLVTQSLFNCDVVALSRQASFDETKANIVALAGAKINKRIYLEKHYPHWQIKQYKSDRACVEAVKRGEADCAIFNSYGIEHIVP
ncbi:MAG: transporter substrate-binding domain-containing protein, partial [Phascolarctobacterium sp.]|nr:transporter substrate-binding domain-containing protein [Phascolarctobacterium sp.]